jgi:DNA-binding transcriptional ArsR family regulator
MTRGEIEKKKRDLDGILKETNAETRLEKLKALAKEVGASVTRMENVQIGERGSKYLYDQRSVITEAEIVHNIQESLQTHVMIDMSKTASRNFWIAVISAATALLAMLAAWAAVVVKFKCG